MTHELDTDLLGQIADLGDQGLSEPAIRLALGVSKATWDQWLATDQVFIDALADAHDRARAHFERELQVALSAGNATLANACLATLKARFSEEYALRSVKKVEGNVTQTNLNLDDKELARGLAYLMGQAKQVEAEPETPEELEPLLSPEERESFFADEPTVPSRPLLLDVMLNEQEDES